MGRQCQFSQTKPVKGRTYCKRGIAKKDKGIGLNITGKSKRRFCPNLVKKKFWLPEEKRFVTLKVSARSMRTMDKIGMTKAVAKMRQQGQKI